MGAPLAVSNITSSSSLCAYKNNWHFKCAYKFLPEFMRVEWEIDRDKYEVVGSISSVYRDVIKLDSLNAEVALELP